MDLAKAKNELGGIQTSMAERRGRFIQMDLHVRSADEKIMDGFSHNDKISVGSETDTDAF